MNKPATKEPSMDEILSSIRQIIADDDAAAAPQPEPRPPAAPVVPAPRPAAAAPLPLSPAQIVPSRPAPAPQQVPVPEPASANFSSAFDDEADAADVSEPMAAMLASEPELVDPEDVAFESEPEPPPAMRSVPPSAPRSPRPAISVAQAAPMPDASLSADLAAELLAPATNAAVQGTMSRLSAIATVGGGQTIEGLMRDMMRPMLKEWLDENLPALVERVVEKEIARISRGVK
ncbi:MAG TPA: DUF2497 domain-containing protein [Devosia sp.]|nr:DUF2497 domain-containing protein [Devosia sp.]